MQTVEMFAWVVNPMRSLRLDASNWDLSLQKNISTFNLHWRKVIQFYPTVSKGEYVQAVWLFFSFFSVVILTSWGLCNYLRLHRSQDFWLLCFEVLQGAQYLWGSIAKELRRAPQSRAGCRAVPAGSWLGSSTTGLNSCLIMIAPREKTLPENLYPPPPNRQGLFQSFIPAHLSLGTFRVAH